MGRIKPTATMNLGEPMLLKRFQLVSFFTAGGPSGRSMASSAAAVAPFQSAFKAMVPVVVYLGRGSVLAVLQASLRMENVVVVVVAVVRKMDGGKKGRSGRGRAATGTGTGTGSPSGQQLRIAAAGGGTAGGGTAGGGTAGGGTAAAKTISTIAIMLRILVLLLVAVLATPASAQGL